MKKEKLRAKVRNNRGFSLIEVLLAIVILGLIAAPILQLFVTSARINQNSKEMMAATDLATMTLEEFGTMKIDGDKGARKFFTSAGISERLPGYSAYTAVVSTSSYTTLAGFKGASTAADNDDTGNKVIYYAGTSEGGTFALKMNQVEYNNFLFDILVWCEPVNAGDKFFTYNVTVEVYSVSGVPAERDDGTPYTDYTRYTDRLVVVNGAVANK